MLSQAARDAGHEAVSSLEALVHALGVSGPHGEVELADTSTLLLDVFLWLVLGSGKGRQVLGLRLGWLVDLRLGWLAAFGRHADLVVLVGVEAHIKD